jgi:hypothetical protein
MLSVAIPYSGLVAYQCQSFRSGYDFIRSKRRVRLDFQEIILTIPEFAFRKEVKLAGPGPIDHLPKVRSVCHKVYFSLDARHTVSGFTPEGVRLGPGRHGWLWRHCGTSGFALITFGARAAMASVPNAVNPEKIISQHFFINAGRFCLFCSPHGNDKVI